jgi:antibiotic biosynthesis monooxygenase (ABM) superfamily enzyme
MHKPRQKRFRIVIDFDSVQDMDDWAEGTEKRPYAIQRQDELHRMNEKQRAFIKTYHVSAFLDQDAPEEKDLHPIAQGIRMSRLG